MFRRFGIRTRLFTLLAVPTVALLVVAASGVLRADAMVDDARRMQPAVEQLEATADLVDALQAERQASLVFIRSGRADGASRVGTAREATDAAIDTLAARLRAPDDSGSPADADALRDVQERRDALAGHRALILGDAETGMTAAHTAAPYDRWIADLVAAAERLGDAADDVPLADGIDGWTRLERYTELVWRERMIVTAVLRADRMSADERVALAGVVGATQSTLAGLVEDAPTAVVERVEDYLDDPRTEAADTIRRLVVGLHAVGSPTLGFDPATYDSAVAWELDRLSVVSDELIGDLFDRVRVLQTDAERQVALFFGVTAVAVLLGLLLTLVTVRSLVRPVRHLDRSARQLRQRLPAAVEQLSRPDAHVDLEAVLPGGARAADVRSTPELDGLAEALDAVGQVAVEVAGDQARLRAGVSEMFTNFARRNQRLLDRQLTLIDTLESDEDDPDRLAELFALDHLATRMRRNAESLLVLAGDESRAAPPQPVPAADVVRAAVSEIEHFQRVDIESSTPALVAGRASAALAHLVAELLENATTFSPPSTPVTVSIARTDDAGLRITVTDRGIGMSDRQLADANERIADPPLIDAAVSRLLGFYVVGRLAGRLGVHVRLSSVPSGGVRAVVTVPTALVVDRGAADPTPGAAPAAPGAGGDAGAHDGADAAHVVGRGRTGAAGGRPAASRTIGVSGPQEGPVRRPVTAYTASGLAKRAPRGPAPSADPAPSAVPAPTADLAPTNGPAPAPAAAPGSRTRTASPLPPRTPRRVVAETEPAPQARRPLSPDTIASTLSSLQSAWRQVNDPAAHDGRPAPEAAPATAGGPPGPPAGRPAAGHDAPGTGPDRTDGHPLRPSAAPAPPGRAAARPAPRRAAPASGALPARAPASGDSGAHVTTGPRDPGRSQDPRRQDPGRQDPGRLQDPGRAPAQPTDAAPHPAGTPRASRRPRRSTTPSWSTPWPDTPDTPDMEEGR